MCMCTLWLYTSSNQYPLSRVEMVTRRELGTDNILAVHGPTRVIVQIIVAIAPCDVFTISLTMESNSEWQ